ncbi:hypothetical protein HJG54_28165 [Leptolyngbya sp. NK1-12]|uniref:Integrase SAM-like N-terminal domain-containing protein n=2 Tax=Leptolyngbya sp. NK1-12 TaxID=2547451 RepID=A0AA96WKE1_9CYAN|nr:hypothetical protein HJG54_28165 [Leptolyngbya sp. NK1-12]
MNARPKQLLDQVRDVIRLKHYSFRTEERYLYWIRRYILFYHKHHPKLMDSAAIEAFLTHLAVEERVAASTQNQEGEVLSFAGVACSRSVTLAEPQHIPKLAGSPLTKKIGV